MEGIEKSNTFDAEKFRLAAIDRYNNYSLERLREEIAILEKTFNPDRPEDMEDPFAKEKMEINLDSAHQVLRSFEENPPKEKAKWWGSEKSDIN